MTDERPQTSRRDRDMLRAQLTSWLATRVDDPVIGDLSIPATNGMSSETLLFDITYRDANGAPVDERCVARLPPDDDATPVFPRYDMEMQFEAMRLVGARTSAPVPACLWLETDRAHLGTPFFVMRRVDGTVPPDLMPYTFGGNWLFDASPAEQRRVQDASVVALAEVHRIAADDPALRFMDRPSDGRSALRAHVDGWRDYHHWVIADGLGSPLCAEAFAHLEATWPEETEARLSWGDSRIGNILYADFDPVAVLDWEMAGIAPREVDLGWMVFLHRFFQDLAVSYGMPGLPEFMRVDDVCDVYERASGYRPISLHWFMEYAAARHAAIMFRIARRSAAFGETPMPDDPDLTIPHAGPLREMIAGTYWDRLP